MRTLTDSFNSYVEAGGRLYYRATLILNDGTTTLQLTNDDFMQDSWTFQYDSCEGDFEIGGAIPSQFSCEINNTDGRFNQYFGKFDGAEIKVYLYSASVTEQTGEDGVTRSVITPLEEFHWGNYILDYDGMSASVIKLEGCDKLLLLKQANFIEICNSLDSSLKIPYINSQCYFVVSFYYVLASLNWILTKKFNLKFKTEAGVISTATITKCCFVPEEWLKYPSIYRTLELAQYITTVKNKYNEQYVGKASTTADWNSYSVLDVLKYAAQVMGCFVVIDENDYVIFKQYQRAAYIDVIINDTIEFTYGSKEGLVKNIYIQTKEQEYPVNYFFYSLKPSGDSGSTHYEVQAITGTKNLNQYTYKGVAIPTSFASSTGCFGPKTLTNCVFDMEIKDNPFITLLYNPFSEARYINYHGFGFDTDNNYVSVHDILNLQWLDTQYSSKSSQDFLTAESIYDTWLKYLSIQFREINAKIPPLPKLQIGDLIRIKKDNWTSYTTVITHITFTPNKNTTINNTYSPHTLTVSPNCDTWANYFNEMFYAGLKNNSSALSAIMDTNYTSGTITLYKSGGYRFSSAEITTTKDYAQNYYGGSWTISEDTGSTTITFVKE